MQPIPAAWKERFTIKKGKFDHPRSTPHLTQAEQKELEQAFRQVTEAANSHRPAAGNEDTAADETVVLPAGEVAAAAVSAGEASAAADKTATVPAGEASADKTIVIPTERISDAVEKTVVFSAGTVQEEARAAAPVQEPPAPAAPVAPAAAPAPRQPAPAAPQQPEPPVNPTIARNRNRKIAFISICTVVGVLVLSLVIGLTVYFLQTADNGLILDNVYVAGINLGGQTPEEAKVLLNQAAKIYKTTDLVIRFPDGELTLSPADTQAELNVDALVEQAFAYGRDGSRSQRVKAAAAAKLGKHQITVLDNLTLNTRFLQQAIEGFHDSHATQLTQPQISIEGERPTEQPDFSDNDFDPLTEVFQTLTIVVGTPRQVFDTKALYNEVLDAYNHCDFTPIEQSYTVTPADSVDLDKLVKDYCVAPVDAKMNQKDYSIIPEVYGFGFDQKQAETLLQEAAFGETVTLELTYQAPKDTVASLRAAAFKDVLAEYDSVYYLNPPRTNNLELACAAIDGFILDPGQTFSFNDVLGERTPEKGYLPAGAYADGETVNQVGGGICQVASTLYYTALHADLEILERYEHMFTVDYVPLGMDATINWGTLDFRFRNNTDHPILIEANARNSYVTVRLRGTNDKDYYVKMEYEVIEELEAEEVIREMAPDNEDGYTDGQVIQSGYSGYIVDTYRCKYSTASNALISRDYESHSAYEPHNKIIVSIVEPTEPTEEPTEESTEETEETEPAPQEP